MMRASMFFRSPPPAALLTVICLLAFPGVSLADNSRLSDPRDPWEGYNRVIYGFNEGVDSLLIKPIAQVYDMLTPKPVDQGITNFFSNLSDIRNSLNNMLQGKPADSFNSLARLTINSTAGLLGFIDVATSLGLYKSEEDFGQTLAIWGSNPGPYFVLPIIGPSTVRDAIATPVDILTNPFTWVDDGGVAFGHNVVGTIDLRADLLDTEEAIEGITQDEYSLMRNAYLEQREFEVTDGAADDTYDYDLME